MIKGFGSFVGLNAKAMSEKEFQSLMDLFKRAAEEARFLTKEEALAQLVRAGIFDKDGNYTEPYKILELATPR